MPTYARIGAFAVIAFLVVGCSAAAPGAESDHPAAVAPSSTAALATAATPAVSASEPPSAATLSPSPEPAIHLVGLGDSIAGAGHCGSACRSYVEVFGELATAALSEPIDVQNLGSNESLGSYALLRNVKSDPWHRRLLTKADLITIDIGWNDWQGPCTWGGHAACLKDGMERVEANLGQTLDEIAGLRGDRPTAIRVVTYANPYIGDPRTAEYWSAPAADLKKLQATFKAALKGFNAMLCRVAKSHGAVCVDIVPAFNGDDGGSPIPDELRDSQAQMDLIAHTIDAAGYAPIGR